jgi:hypothetical protein
MSVKWFRLVLVVLLLVTVVSCGKKRPRNVTDSCSIFTDKSGWYKHAYRSYKKYGIPVSIQLAIIYQESGFRHDAKTPRKKLLWVIPWTRQSSAYGYAQVKDGTWKWYKRSTGKRFVSRKKFKDVVYFIGWYNNISHRRLGIRRNDAYHLYLAYHEGHGGFARRTYRHKPWLRRVARKVQRRANIYQAQMDSCRRKLKKGWRLWPF